MIKQLEENGGNLNGFRLLNSEIGNDHEGNRSQSRI